MNNVTISVKAEIIHKRIDPSDPEYQPKETFIEANEREIRLVQWYRLLTETDQKMYFEEIATIGLHTLQERQRTKRRDALREKVCRA